MTTVPSASSLLDIYGRHAILKIIIKILFLINKEIVLVIFMYVIIKSFEKVTIN
jgi:hypothetical protein